MHIFSFIKTIILLFLQLSCSILWAFQSSDKGADNPDYAILFSQNKLDSVVYYLDIDLAQSSSQIDSIALENQIIPMLLQQKQLPTQVSKNWINQFPIQQGWKTSYKIAYFLTHQQPDSALHYFDLLELKSSDALALKLAACHLTNHFLQQKKGLEASVFYQKSTAHKAISNSYFWQQTKADYCSYTGRFYEATEAYDKMLEIQTQKVHTNTDELYRILCLKALNYQALKAYNDASKCMLDAIALLPASTQNSSERAIQDRLLLARLYSKQTDKQLEALLCLRTIKTLFTGLPSAQKRAYQLEVDLWMATQFVAAQRLDSAALYLVKIQKNNSTIRQAEFFELQHRIFIKNGRYKQALQALENKRSLLLNMKGSKGEKLAETYLSLAVLQHKHQHYKKAIELSEKAFASIYLPKSTDSILSIPLAIRIKQQQIASMMKWYELSKYNISLQKINIEASHNLDLLKQYYRQSTAVQLCTQHQLVVEQYIQVKLWLFERMNEQRFLEQVFTASEWSRKVKVSTVLRGQNKAVFADIPASILTKHFQLKEQLLWLKKQHCLHSIQNDTSNQFWRQQLIRDSQEALAATASKLLRDYPDYLDLFNPQTIGLQEVQQTLDSNTCLIHYFEGENTVFQLLVNADSCTVRSIQWDNYTTAILKYADYFSDNKLNAAIPTSDFKDFCLTSYQLYYKIMHHDFVESADRIVLVPDGLMQLIPFETLLRSVPLDETKAYDFAKLDYILKTRSIAYQLTAAYQKPIIKRSKSRRKARIFGMSASYKDNLTAEFRSDALKLRRQSVSVLTSSNAQTDILAQKFEGDHYVDKYATEYYFKKFASNYEVLHLALAAKQLSPASPYLVFSEDEYAQEDNFLDLHEIQALSLKPGLVTLTNTGYDPSNTSSTIGFSGLSAAFLYAGCQSIMHTLWKQDTATITPILENYYSYLKAEYPKDIALQKAKNDYLKQVKGQQGHPYFWASLVQYGSLDPLVISEPVIHIWWFVLPIAFIGFLGWWCMQALKQRRK